MSERELMNHAYNVQTILEAICGLTDGDDVKVSGSCINQLAQIGHDSIAELMIFLNERPLEGGA